MNRKLVFTEIYNAVHTYDSNVYITQRYENIPESIPCVFVIQTYKIRTQRYATLCNTDEQYAYTFEVQVFSETLENAYNLMGVVENTFKSLGFFEETCREVPNAEKNIQRLVARFSAQLGATL